MAKSKLPIGIQSFRKIRENGLRYVDKTGYAAQLAGNVRGYFLSRPRRFGKSLFVDTLKELFEGNEALFRGLAIHGDWDWSDRYPVIHLKFGGKYNEEGGLERRMSEILGRLEREANLPLQSTTLEGRFSDLIYGLRKKTGQPVVVLVDEYDKPILDAINNPDLAHKNRETLQGFYSILKDEDDSIRFCFVTGVTQFAHVGLFSGANHLDDISLVPEYSAICGYTESDLDRVFTKELTGFDREAIRDWYNGYCWRGDERVYNPFGLLKLLERREFDIWWYESGTPTFLIEIMKKRGILPIMLEDMEVTSSDLKASEIDNVSVDSLLFQTGYMTITEETRLDDISTYNLNYPNREVRHALNKSMLTDLLSLDSKKMASNRKNLINILEAGEVDKLESILHSMLAGIPHQWHTKSGAANYEVYFASVIYAYFIGWGLDVRVEDSTSEGRIDLAVIRQSYV